MAQKVNIVLVDDMDGSEAVRTMTFGLDGTQYEIDLNAKNAKALEKVLAPYVAAARKVTARRGRAAAASTVPTARRGGGRKKVVEVEDIEKSKTAKA